MPLTIAAVMKSGGWCKPADVTFLRDGAVAHLQAPHRFVCLTDTAIPGVECLPLTVTLPDGAPKWFHKMELFRPGLLSGRVLYFDLDTIIVGDLSELAAYDGAFGLISDFYRPSMAQTGIMAWDADGPWPAKLWDAFHPATCLGSQARLVASVLQGREDRLDALYPSQIVSLKVHCRTNVPDGARVVCLHGKPRPCEVPTDHPIWKAAA